jgi:hypothetical protein
MSRAAARVYAIYRELARQAPAIRAAAEADGEAVSGTIQLLTNGDRAKPLARWAEEMAELEGVLDGSHDDPYALEATQCFYWASLYAALGGADWRALDPFARPALPGTALAAAAQQVAAAGSSADASPLFGLWLAAYRRYRATPRFAPHAELDAILAEDLAEMATRAYLRPILAAIPG